MVRMAGGEDLFPFFLFLSKSGSFFFRSTPNDRSNLEWCPECVVSRFRWIRPVPDKKGNKIMWNSSFTTCPCQMAGENSSISCMCNSEGRIVRLVCARWRKRNSRSISLSRPLASRCTYANKHTVRIPARLYSTRILRKYVDKFTIVKLFRKRTSTHIQGQQYCLSALVQGSTGSLVR